MSVVVDMHFRLFVAIESDRNGRNERRAANIRLNLFCFFDNAGRVDGCKRNYVSTTSKQKDTTRQEFSIHPLSHFYVFAAFPSLVVKTNRYSF